MICLCSLRFSFIQAVKLAVRDSIFSGLSAEQWLGHRVRAATRRIMQAGESASEVLEQGNAVSVYSTGTVRLYRPSTGEHLVVFDEPLLQPVWLVCQKSTIDVLLGAEETAPTTSSSAAAGECSTALQDSANNNNSSSSSSGGNGNSSNRTQVDSEEQMIIPGSDITDFSHQCACTLCKGALPALHKGRELGVKRCTKCDMKCHSYCVSDDSAFSVSVSNNTSSSSSSTSGTSTAAQQNWANSSALPWTCWNCVGEYEHCHMFGFLYLTLPLISL